MQLKNKVLLIILDGFGLGTNPEVDAIAKAKKPYIDNLLSTCKWTSLSASGEDVGLPMGQMGNSEVGHLNIGAGRVVYQEITRIDRSIRMGDFFEKKAFLDAIENAKKNNSNLHLIGLLSDGGVHSMNTHLYALLDLAKKHNLSKVYVHALLDGRDTPPESGAGYIQQLLDKMKETKTGEIATVMGRYYGMDRDKRWERTEQAYRALTEGKGVQANDAVTAVQSSYKNGLTDEFVLPIILQKNNKPIATINDGDSVIFFNFRSDRARQLTKAFTENDFDAFKRRKPDIYFATMTQYEDDFKFPVAFPPAFLTNTLGEIVSKLKLKQLHIAETEKYAHVTFFFNGGREEPFEGESRILVPSPREVATYDLKPEMSAFEVTDKLIEQIKTNQYSFIVVNYANCDMVGHAGKMDAAIKAVEAIDTCLNRVIPCARQNEYVVLITADHGNADKMADENGEPFTAHTTNPVPFIVVKNGFKGTLRKEGKLSDIAPTILQFMGFTKPKEMDGVSLVDKN
jgi:2,3-bisphosphoglycerate-independent phosphoglycerate mutase